MPQDDAFDKKPRLPGAKYGSHADSSLQSGDSERFAKDEHNGGAPVCVRRSLRNSPLNICCPHDLRAAKLTDKRARFTLLAADIFSHPTSVPTHNGRTTSSMALLLTSNLRQLARVFRRHTSPALSLSSQRRRVTATGPAALLEAARAVFTGRPVSGIDGSIGLRRLLQWVAVSISVVRHVCLRVKSPEDVVRLLRQASRLIASEGLRGLQVRAKCSAAILAKSKAGEGAIYARWVSLYDTPTDGNLEAMRRLERDFDRRPLISVVMPVYNAPANFLCAAIDSLLAQTYPNWELCIADDCSTAPHVRKVLSAYAQKDARIHIVFRDHNGHISKASNSALALARGEWVALLDHDDTLPPHALFYVVAAINAQPDVKLIYSDEDKIDAEARRHSPYFKPDWNLDLFLSHNVFSHLGVYRADLIREVGGFRTGFEGSQDYDLALRCVERVQSQQICHIPRVLYHWRTLPGSTSVSTYEKSYAVAAGERALNEHLARTRPGARAQFVGRGYRARYSPPSPAPLVSLIIPTRNGRGLLERCLTSIRRLTDYPNYEILVVDNGSDDRSTLAYLETLKAPGFRVLRDDRPFNYSALNNGAVSVAKGSILALVNNDIEVISGGWLSEMVAIAAQDGVGAVGARLWYPDERLQHGGIVLGLGGVAGHAHKFLGQGQPGYCCRAALQQSFSAVTAACLVVRKDRYLEVGGMDEVNLAVAFNDVDFCLKLLQAGYRNVWTPHAELYHHESASRGEDRTPEQQRRFRGEVAYMQRRWGHLLTRDRAYNPNLTLDRDDFSLAFPPRVPPFVDLLPGNGIDPPLPASTASSSGGCHFGQ